MSENYCEKELEVILTEEQLDNVKLEIIRLTTKEIPDLEEEKKASNSHFSKTISNLKERSMTLAKIAEEGREIQMVKCTWRYNEIDRKMELLRADTFEVVESRDLTTEESQIYMPFMDSEDLKGQPHEVKVNGEVMVGGVDFAIQNESEDVDSMGMTEREDV